jgi:hypothetical protein
MELMRGWFQLLWLGEIKSATVRLGLLVREGFGVGLKPSSVGTQGRFQMFR